MKSEDRVIDHGTLTCVNGKIFIKDPVLFKDLLGLACPYCLDRNTAFMDDRADMDLTHEREWRSYEEDWTAECEDYLISSGRFNNRW